MENWKLETDRAAEIVAPGPILKDGDGKVSSVFSEAEPSGKTTMNDRIPSAESPASSFPNGTHETSAVQNGESPPGTGYGTDPANGVGGGPETVEEDEEVDADGYKVEERRETETVSHTEEITELRERTELRTREIKEVTLEEVKSKESTRQMTPEEFEAIIEAEFYRKDEVQLGRDIIIEEFTRVESEHEEVSGGKVTVATFSVQEEHKTEEFKEQFQFGGADFSDNGFGGVDGGPDGENDAENVHVVSGGGSGVETVDKAQESSETTAEAELKQTEQEDLAEKKEEAVQNSEGVTGSDDAKKDSTSAENKDKEDKDTEDKDTEDKEKVSKSRGFINYIKVKARSLSRDRTHNRAVVAVPSGNESSETTKENPLPKDEGKSSTKKGKQQKWKIFRRKSVDHDDSSSEDSASPEDGKQNKEVFQQSSEDKAKPPEGEGGTEKASLNEETGQEVQAEKGKAEDKGPGAKTKEHKWFHFGKKSDKESHEKTESSDKGKESPEEGKKKKVPTATLR